MNKLKITLTIVVIFLMIIVVAQIIPTRTTDIELTKDNVTKLVEHKITDPIGTDLRCDTEYCYYKMYQDLEVIEEGDPERYYLGEYKIKRDNKTRLQLEAEQDLEIEKNLIDFSNMFAEEDLINDTREIIANKTQITIKEIG